MTSYNVYVSPHKGSKVNIRMATIKLTSYSSDVCALEIVFNNTS